MDDNHTSVKVALSVCGAYTEEIRPWTKQAKVHQFKVNTNDSISLLIRKSHHQKKIKNSIK